MGKIERIENVIYRSMDTVIENLGENINLEKSANTALFGDKSILDSIGLVNLIVSVEEELRAEFEVIITLADDRAMSQTQSPFLTVGSLVNYIQTLLEEKDV